MYAMPLYFWLILLFLLGTMAGSFLNVCIYRIPFEKSIIWPPSCCGNCLRQIRWYDNIPLLSYLLLLGRCRHCGARFSIRYFIVELLTGLGFVGLYCLEVVSKPDVPGNWLIYGYHTILFCFLMVVSFCDMEHQEIPISVTITGTIVGLVGGALLTPMLPASAHWKQTGTTLPGINNLELRSGIYPWPVWSSLPEWLSWDSWLTGLLTGLAGALVGMLVLRGLRFIFGMSRGKEGIGIGDADMMMMAGSFLGWQPVTLAFFIAVFPGLLFGIIHLIRRGNQPLPFGPALAIGVLITVLRWPGIGPRFQLLFFDPTVMLVLGALGAGFLFLAGFLLRWLHAGEK